MPAPNQISALIIIGVALALPLPRAQHSHAENDVGALQAPAGGGDPPVAVDEKALEARVLARLRHQLHREDLPPWELLLLDPDPDLSPCPCLCPLQRERQHAAGQPAPPPRTSSTRPRLRPCCGR